MAHEELFSKNTEMAISLENLFEGPLSILITLAARQEVDAQKIQIASLFDQYRKYEESASHKKIDIGADFAASCSSLHFIKSDTLIGRYGDSVSSHDQTAENDEETATSTEELDRLFEALSLYEKLQDDTKLLEELETESLSHYSRPAILPEVRSRPLPAEVPCTIEDLHRLFQGILFQRKNRPVHRVQEELWTFEKAQAVLIALFENTKNGAGISLESIFLEGDTIRSIEECIALFLALLELMKQGSVHFYRIEDTLDTKETYLFSLNKKRHSTHKNVS